MKALWLHSVRLYLRLALWFYYKKIVVVKNAKIPNKIFTKVLKSLRMIPVYRIRDGWSSLSNNAAIFENCTDLLHKNEALALFPEGNHNLKRSVRPLSKGFTRIIFETLQRYPETDLKLIPVGVNYQNATAFGDSAAICFGAPLSVNAIISRNKNESVRDLKTRILVELKQLTTHIPMDSYDAILKTLESQRISFLDPQQVNKVITNQDINLGVPTQIKPSPLKPFFKWLVSIVLFGPYLVWRFLIKPKVASPEFLGTFRFAVGISLVPLWILLVSFILIISINSFPLKLKYF